MMFHTREVGTLAENGSVVIKIRGDDSPFQSTLKSLGSAVSTTMKAMAAAAGVASAGIAALGTAAIHAYADYEQLAGGVETLFKDSAKVVQAYADNAYQTAGMSANAYMETVTGFSASLLQSLGGDTEAAARYADQAITDMADNANKMGTSMELIQNAYQGFAKQNYTMLDNLKLGYGGTKEEMQRLLEDAEKLSGTQYDISSFADITEAIHVIQTEMEITGTTAKEASTTIQGSIASMKASWTNLMVGMADDTQDFDMLLGNFIASIGTVAENLLPRIGVVVEGMGKLVAGLAPEITAALPALTEELLPNLAELGMQAVSSLIEGVQENSGSLAEGAMSILGTLGEGMIKLLPMLADTAASLIASLAAGMKESLPEMVPVAVEAIGSLVENLTDNADSILQAGIDIILALGQGIINALPQLIQTVPQIVINIADVINQNASRMLGAALQLIVQLGAGLIQSIPTLIANIPAILEAIVKAFFAFQWVNLGANLITAIGNGIKSMGGTMANAAAEVSRAFAGKIKELPQALLQIGKDIVKGLINGIKGAIPALGQAAREMSANLLTNVKSFFRIASPSKVMKEEVGEMLGEGIAIGITESGKEAVKAAEGVADDIVTAMTGVETAIPFARRTARKVGDVLKAEAEKTNSALEALQKKATEEQAAEELKQYQENLAKKHEELNKAEKKNKQKIQDEIAKLEADWNKKQTDAARTAEQKKLQEKLSALQEFQREYESALSAIESKQSSLSDKLGDYGSLFERVETEEGKELFQLGDLDAEIRKIEKYGEAIDRLQEKGISDGLLSEISGMGVDDALDYMDKLISMSDTKFDQYVELFAKKQQAAQGVAEKFYQEEFNALERSYTEKLPESLEGVKEGMYQAGTEAAQSLKDGLQADGTSLGDTVADAVSSAVVGAGEATQKENFLQITEGMQEQEPILTEYIEGLKETLIALIESYYSDFQDVGEQMMAGVAEGIEDGRSGVVNAVARVIAAAVRRAREDLDINSPSKVFAEIGGYMAQGIGVGWTERMERVSADIGGSLSAGMEKRMAGAYQRMKAAMQEGMQKLTGDIAVQSRGNTAYNTYTTTHQEGDFIVQIEKVVNEGKETVASMMQEFEFVRRQQVLAKGGV